jgi:hypothetical protein
MSIISKQTGYSNGSNLLYAILKEIDDICKALGPTIITTNNVYSQVVSFSTPMNSIIYRCNGTQVAACYSPGGVNNITDLVALFNSNPGTSPGCPDPTYCYCWTNYGTYFDNGDGRIRLQMPVNIYNSLCSGGTLTMEVIYD